MSAVSAKKLIEVALPLDAINEASAREKSIRHGHPSTLHLWWARRPLAAARAVIFAQMVDDPSSRPDLFPTEKAQEKERQRLFGIIEDLVKWENTTNEEVLQKARDEIWESWRRACAENADHPRAKELFDRSKLPAFHDPFAGGGSLPLEAQRLGLEAHASDLNPVAVLINKAMIEFPPKFAGLPPVNPEARGEPSLIERTWKGAEGLAEDVRYYARWMRDEAERRIGALYPKVTVTDAIAEARPDLADYAGRELTVIAWLWARTVPSPDPGMSGAHVPLMASFWLSKKKGKLAWVEPVVDRENRSWRFEVRTGTPRDRNAISAGTKVGRGDFACLFTGAALPASSVRELGRSGMMGDRLVALVADTGRARVYLPVTKEDEDLARVPIPDKAPTTDLPEQALGFRVQNYGYTTHASLYTPRQLTVLDTLASLVSEARSRVAADARDALTDPASPEDSDRASAYADAVAVMLGIAVSRRHDRWSAFTIWYTGGEKLESMVRLSALPMTWEFAEGNPFSDSTGNFLDGVELSVKAIQALGTGRAGRAEQCDARGIPTDGTAVICTDPPYYDNVPYADLSDLFYVWLRRTLRPILPDLMSTVLVPKADELVADAARHGGKDAAEQYFLDGMREAVAAIRDRALPAVPITIFYAFKQSEARAEGVVSTGWETFLTALIDNGLAVVGTWPVRTEQTGGLRNVGRSSLASSIVLVCRPRSAGAKTVTRRELRDALRTELPGALAHLQHGNIAPVDLAQAAIGPGMAVFTRYAQVMDAGGEELSVRAALALINEVLDEVLAEQEGDFDADTRWAVAWFEQFGFEEGEFGVAETLSKAKNTSVVGLAEAGILASKAGRVRLLTPEELPPGWSPETDERLTTWEIVHHLIRVLEASGGELSAAELVGRLGGRAELARELAYRLYSIGERKKRSEEALRYNGLVRSWPEITRLAKAAITAPAGVQTGLFDGEDG